MGENLQIDGSALRDWRRWRHLLLLVVLLSVALPSTAEAHHGAWHYNQHQRNETSCCLEVQAHTRCSDNCDTIISEVKKNGVLYGNSCFSETDACYQVYSPWRAFSFPVTVRTRHAATAGFWHQRNLTIDNTYS